MDSPCRPPQTLNTTASSRRGSSSSGPPARHWPASPTKGPSRAGSSTSSKDLANEAVSVVLFLRAINTQNSLQRICVYLNIIQTEFGPFYHRGIRVTLRQAVCLLNTFFSPHLLSFVSSEGVSYMTVCHCSLPVAKAFCFLEDLRWEFTASFKSTVVALAARPYPFLEFGE